MKLLSKVKSMKKETMVIMVSVMCLTIATVGVSYSAFMDVGVNNGENVISTGDVIIDFGSNSSLFAKNNLEISNDSVALSAGNKTSFYIQNNGKANTDFVMTVNYDLTSIIGDYQEKMIPLEYIKMAVFKYDSESSTMMQVSDIINLIDTTLYKYTPSETIAEEYIIYQSTIEKMSSGNNNTTYAIKAWLDENTPVEYLEEDIYLNLNVIAEEDATLTDYNITGKLVDANNNVLPNSTISIQNGSIKTTTDSEGNFKLENVSEGSYKIDIIKIDGIKISGTLKIENQKEISLAVNSESHSLDKSDTIESIVYTYGTTIKQVMNINKLIEQSNKIELENIEKIILPKVYIISGGLNQEINNLTIKVSNTNIENMSLS